ncbi:ABC transporter substrate-binding protein [Streptomyces sp. ODS28]|uniref:ABC transporter substrate-binding protein n=1 Tax=Streptomyces sp. ODS28 TaxID=3136688 RepID=UPI0031E82521
MHMKRAHTTRTAAATAVTALGALLLTSCGAGNAAVPETQAAGGKRKFDDSPQQHRVRGHKDAKLAAQVPAKIRKRGTLAVGSSTDGSPPLNFYASDDRTPIGVETDIATLVADNLGLKARIEPSSWENLFVGLDSGKLDAGFSNITVTEERKQKYDFATYREDQVSFETRKGGGLGRVRGPADLAGKRVAVSSGTNQEKILTDWSARNRKAGRKPIDIRYFQRSSDYYLALQSGRIDAYLGPNPNVAYHVATSGQTRSVGTLSGGGGSVQGKIAATTKKDNGLVKALHGALNKAIEDGSYAKVLKRWDLSTESVPRSEINPPGLPAAS